MSKSNSTAPGRYVPIHERKSGWDEYDLDEALRNIEITRKIEANKPLVTALRKHAAEKLKAAQNLSKSTGGK